MEMVRHGNHPFQLVGQTSGPQNQLVVRGSAHKRADLHPPLALAQRHGIHRHAVRRARPAPSAVSRAGIAIVVGLVFAHRMISKSPTAGRTTHTGRPSSCLAGTLVGFSPAGRGPTLTALAL